MAWSGDTANWSNLKPQPPARTQKRAPIIQAPPVNRTYFNKEEIERASKTTTVRREFDNITVKLFRSGTNDLLASFSGLSSSPGLTVSCGPASIDPLVRLIVRGDKSRSATW